MAVNRNIATLHPTDQVPLPADTCTTFLMTGGSSAQAVDLPSGAEIVRVTPMTTAGGAFHCFLNLASTAAAVPTSGTTNSSASSSGISTPVMGPLAFQVPGGSTGLSVAAISSGYVFIEYWGK